MVDERRKTDPEAQLASYFAKYEQAMARFGKALRAKLRARLPGLFEIVYVYESQDALVISYSPTGHGYGGVCSIALYPHCVKLFFGQGAQLSKSDPNGLLQGRGKTVRHVVLDSVADFDRAEIEVLMAAALKLAKVRLDVSAKGAVIIKAEEQKARASRVTKAAPKAAPAAAASAVSAASAARAPAAAATSTPASVPASAAGNARFVVQVGAFADVAAARAARLRVEKLGFKTFTQVIETPAGKRIRVRVGPFDAKGEADKAALGIRKGDLPAAVLAL